MDLKSHSKPSFKSSHHTSLQTSRTLNETYKGTGGSRKITGATRSRSVIRESTRNNTFRSTSVQRGTNRNIKDAHERFRDRIINGRDINDVEEELNNERAKTTQMETVIKMKESQILKYSKGLEKAKGILKGMVESTQEKMGKLQEKVDSLQAALQQRDSQLRDKDREISQFTESLKGTGHTTQSLRQENERILVELEAYRTSTKQATDRYEGRQAELQSKNSDLSSNNHRLTTELARIQAQMQRRIRDDQEKTAEIERLQMRLLELEGGTFMDANARNLAIARARAEMEKLEGKLAGVHAMMDDVEFFVSIKNELDDFETAASKIAVSSGNKENLFVPQLKSHPTFDKLLETSDSQVLLEVQQRLNREIEEDRVNCRRALKELQSQAYLLNHNYDDMIATLDSSTSETSTVMDAFGDIEASLERLNGDLNHFEIYGDVRDQTEDPEANKLLAGFREDFEEKPASSKPGFLNFNSDFLR